jgi:NAD(P)-dependent dehydrogenase (short-subunit alcohol dehydrogenase family)
MTIADFYKDKVVLITGGSMGIGKELARQVLELGGFAVITGRNNDRLKLAEKEFENFSGRLLTHTGDVTSWENNDLLMGKIRENFGRLNIIINNAGMSSYGELEVLEPAVAKQVIDTNIYGSLFPVMTGLRHFRSSLQSILFVSSIAGFFGLPAYAAYSLSKRSLQALAQSLRIELQSHGVFVGISHVGFTENDEDKKTLSPSGELEKIPPRPKPLVSTKSATAEKILMQIKRRKNSQTHSLFGKFIYFLSNYFPGLLHFLMKKKYLKENRSAEK